MALVVSIVKGETSVAEAARKHGLTVAEIEDWQERFFVAAENALRARPKDEEALKDEQIKKLNLKERTAAAGFAFERQVGPAIAYLGSFRTVNVG